MLDQFTKLEPTSGLEMAVLRVPRERYMMLPVREPGVFQPFRNEAGTAIGVRLPDGAQASLVEFTDNPRDYYTCQNYRPDPFWHDLLSNLWKLQ